MKFVDEFREPKVITKTSAESAASRIPVAITVSWRCAAATLTRFTASA